MHISASGDRDPITLLARGREDNQHTTTPHGNFASLMARAVLSITRRATVHRSFSCLSRFRRQHEDNDQVGFPPFFPLKQLVLLQADVVRNEIREQQALTRSVKVNLIQEAFAQKAVLRA